MAKFARACQREPVRALSSVLEEPMLRPEVESLDQGDRSVSSSFLRTRVDSSVICRERKAALVIALDCTPGTLFLRG